MENKVVAVIIPVFNGLNFTKICLQSLDELRDYSGFATEQLQVVVVDDGSKDGTHEWIRENCPWVHVLTGDGSLWWSGGINTGVRFALDELNSDYILWWNNDIISHRDYIKNLFNIISKSPENVLIGSKIFVIGSNELIWGMGGKFDPVSGDRYMYGEQQADSSFFQSPLDVDWFPGMGTTIHRSVFEKIGYLDEINFPQYHGDSDYTFRAKKAGFTLIAYPELVIYNDVSNTGIKHNGSFKDLRKSLFSIKSNYNIRKDISFFRIHATTFKAYRTLFKKYFRYVGGFIKWKLLNLIGIRKANPVNS